MLYDRLAPPERESLVDVESDPDHYGLLRPRNETDVLSVKAVDRETALLFLTLATAAPLPAYVSNLFGADTGRAVARLVADSVLEVDVGGGFLCGANALQLLEKRTDAAGKGRVATLSSEALRYAQALPITDQLSLAERIYNYNRLPLTPSWHRLLPDSATHARYLGITTGGPAVVMLAREWSALSAPPPWIFWSARRKPSAPSGGRSYKLYVSPTPQALSGAGFAEIVSALGTTRAAHFKVGADAAGLLRPDKIVAYFLDFDSLAEAIPRLRERLDGMPAHGVPFTAETDRDGLLSWGVDPPHGSGVASLVESWRLWIARRLAQAMLSGRAASEPWRFTVERLALEGIDTETWTPAARIFEEA